MRMNAERLHEVRRRAFYLFWECARQCVIFLPLTVWQLVRHGRFRRSRAWRSRPDACFWLNAQTAAHKRGASEITPADLQAAVDAGSKLLPRYGHYIPTYSADAACLVQDAVDSAGGRLNATAIEHLRTALVSWWATGSDYPPGRSRPEVAFWMNVQTAGRKRGAREITPADLQAAVDAGGEVLPRCGHRVVPYSADARRLVQDAVEAGGWWNATAFEHVRTALASWWATGSGSEHEPI